MYAASSARTWLTSWFLFVVGCGGEVTDTEAGLENTNLFVASQLVWPTSQVPVCWVNPRSADAEGRERTRAGAARWEAVSPVRFVGWGECVGDLPQIRIAVGDNEWPRSYIGTGLPAYGPTMWLNFTFAGPDARQNFSGCTTDAASRDFCIHVIATHEFGHALGFDHEQERPDTPTWCPRNEALAQGDTLIGPWDRLSVMNYCNPRWNGDGELSDIDIAGVRAVYGRAEAVCSEGAKECLDGDVFWECVGGVWSAAYSCAASYPGTVCSGGYCVSGGGGGGGGGGGCAEGAKECLDGDLYRECAGGAWSGAYSCSVSYPGTYCSSGYCVF